ncbi:hypothetical protein KEM55_000741 [Ascosphaera atra]|nr:hypothetical protein KEM55_000741 [Ascosphaera atra]
MDSFEYNFRTPRVVFGSGAVKKLPDELSKLSLKKPLVLSTPGRAKNAELVKDILQGQIAGIYAKAQMHNPVEVTEDALKNLNGADCVVSAGGGSTVGLGKAISVRTMLPHICLPTTYSGSEMTPILGETVQGRKTTRTDPKILPTVVIYDVDFTLSLPARTSATSGMNAIAHAVEALYAKNANPLTNLIAAEGVKALAESLPVIVNDTQNKEARDKALYGAWLCGSCLSSVGMSIHHKLCHTFGGSFGLPHAETHTIVLPHALSYNAKYAPEAMKRLAEVLPDSNGDAVNGLNVLMDKLKVEKGLKAFGLKESDVDKATDIALEKPYWNPRPMERDAIRELIRRCYAGEPARADF